jgi:hypothetical protein
MPDTFGGEWHRPRDTKHRDRQRGHSQRQLQDRASFDNEPQLGCGALFMLCVLAVAAAVGLTLL